MCERLIVLTGGHPGFLKAAYMALLQKKVSLPEDDEQAIKALLAVDDVRTECAKLWGSISIDEQEALRGLATGMFASFRDPDMARRLQLKRLATDQSGGILPFCPLFTIYASEQKAGRPPETKIQAGPIRIDTAGEVWIKDRQIVPPLSKKELLLLEYLCLEPGRLRTKDEIIAVVYPDEYRVGGTVSDDALSALVKRLRDRIEQFSPESNHIVTIRGKGYRLEIS
jgi:DNA-binding winged helix-turn-helix (wHTH) protein